MSRESYRVLLLEFVSYMSKNLHADPACVPSSEDIDAFLTAHKSQRFWKLWHRREGWWVISVTRTDDDPGEFVSGPYEYEYEARDKGRASGLEEWKP